MDTIIGLETLFIDAAETNSYFAEEIEALLERNRNTLKKVYICEHSAQKPDVLKMVENLVGCESLTMKSPHNKSRMPDVEPLLCRLTKARRNCCFRDSWFQKRNNLSGAAATCRPVL